MMLSAKKPVIYTGGGVILSEASQELTRIVRLTGFPITQTLMGLGAYPGTDEQFIGMLGMHGTYEANMAMHETDVLIAIGARFDDRVTGKIAQFCPNARIIHIDIDPASISKNVRVHIPIVGSVKNVLTDIIKIIKANGKQPPNLDNWWKQIGAWRNMDCLKYDQNSNGSSPSSRWRPCIR